ncbi:hypothetical protein N0B44_27820 [Roseibacterium beibuensis]|uniref:Uncharacterized protein n=1 Tax=[Roseibacterium] beibuensis TaxID=1193142 RepID=A0ABP9LMC2_9RHOB|nr:hypothetical protein [Roseibacterium beibuensis]MCS6626734.1 hypothetical protein [Roseibacterium beibuensis]
MTSWKWAALAALVLLPAPAVAFDAESCDRVLSADAVEGEDLRGAVPALIAEPPQFGGRVDCILSGGSATEGGAQTVTVLERVPGADDLHELHVLYRADGVETLSFNRVTERARTITECGRDTDGAIRCRTDLFMGSGVMFDRLIAANGDLMQFGIYLDETRTFADAPSQARFFDAPQEARGVAIEVLPDGPTYDLALTPEGARYRVATPDETRSLARRMIEATPALRLRLRLSEDGRDRDQTLERSAGEVNTALLVHFRLEELMLGAAD